MEQAELEQLRQQFDGEVRNRFPGAPIQRVEVLQYGDEPSVEPGSFGASRFCVNQMHACGMSFSGHIPFGCSRQSAAPVIDSEK